MLHPLAQDGIYRITAGFDRDTLLAFFVDFHDRIRELDDVACRTSRRPCAQDDIDRLDAGLVVGNVMFYRPSVAAMEWLRTCAAAWWGQSTRAYTFALAYACAHREEVAFTALRSRYRASWACWRWVGGVCASEEAIRRAAISLLPPPEGSLKWFASPDELMDVDRTPPDLMGIALRLSRAFGGTASHWLWEVSDNDFWGAVCTLADEKDAELDAASLAAGKGHAEGTWWRKHRKALFRCESALDDDAKAWAARRKPKAAPAAAKTEEAANG